MKVITEIVVLVRSIKSRFPLRILERLEVNDSKNQTWLMTFRSTDPFRPQQGNYLMLMTFVPLKLTNEKRSSFWVRGKNRIESIVCFESKNRITGLNGAAHYHSPPTSSPLFFCLGPFISPGHLPSSVTCHLSPVTWVTRVTLKSPKWSSVFPSLMNYPAHHPMEHSVSSPR